MNRTYLQAVALLLGTIATTVIAAEWRWEPVSAGDYLVIVAPTASATAEDATAGGTEPRHQAIVH
ncbi:hypothetical protein OU994_03445 [Pseudoduganella sp. SL102]|uniref:hypothetical protein n=1 Tax=Pseudoduganella sp. SL102 TaxID=2995154 RepID=UPI00248CA4EE|nr:hypothetical protein [Pseudoduganella sp. SL102]WBS03376.1 hypothetical protein OU994_03445 [Pseudoduganella sp. SL102]